MKTHILIVALMVGLSGCVAGSGARWWSPGTWRSAAAARSLDRAEVKMDEAKEAAVKAAHVEVAKTAEALRSAPESREVVIARRFNGNALGLLNQATGALPVQDIRALENLVTALRSENADIRAAAETMQVASEVKQASLSSDLTNARERLDAAGARLRTAFAKENALANQLRNERMIRWGLIGLTVIVAAGWLYARIALGGIPVAAGKLMQNLRQSRPEIADEVGRMFDGLLNRSEQAAIAKHAK